MGPMHPIARKSMERFLTDECNIDRPGRGEGTLNRNTFAVVGATSTRIYEGDCLVQERAINREVVDGGQVLRSSLLLLKLPADVDGIKVGDLVTITESENVDMVSQVFEIQRASTRTNRGLATYTLINVESMPVSTRLR